MFHTAIVTPRSSKLRGSNRHKKRLVDYSSTDSKNTSEEDEDGEEHEKFEEEEVI